MAARKLTIAEKRHLDYRVAKRLRIEQETTRLAVIRDRQLRENDLLGEVAEQFEREFFASLAEAFPKPPRLQ